MVPGFGLRLFNLDVILHPAIIIPANERRCSQRRTVQAMKIECPSCHLSGKVNELELPPDGRELKCPRCKASFHVNKPPAPAGKQELMSMCPACQYSTFTDEMFAVCPKCGLVGSEYRQNLRKQKEGDQVRRDEDL